MKKALLVLPLIFALGTLNSFAQKHKMAPHTPLNWKNESFKKDSVYGTGSDAALALLKKKKKKPTTVVVAVIDDGVDIHHPALKGEIWTNPKEIAGNKIDDDSNGYVDDVHGWDFIGGKDSDVSYANIELTRLYRYYTQKFSDIPRSKIAKSDMAEYDRYLKIKKKFEAKRAMMLMEYTRLKGFIDTVALLKKATGKKDFTAADLENYKPADSAMAHAKRRLLTDFARVGPYIQGTADADKMLQILSMGMGQLTVAVKYQYNPDFNPRFIVNDDYADASQRYYGNNDVSGPVDEHGTHVSGIIAAKRTGDPDKAEGIANDVKIMAVRVVPNGDERDKDVANGIRYAVDNGAKVVNMSFGKAYVYNKKTVDDAVKYAEAHDVLLIHAAGNNHNNNDSVPNFPTAIFEDGKKANNWIEVGACDDKGRPASFSNYGKNSVDLFAPGVAIYSSVPDTGYAYLSGTSMASPCVAGVAALIREYFPKLTAAQVKKILMESVTKINFKVPMPGYPGTMVNYSDLCISGGVINAYKAVQLALKEKGK